MWIDRRIKRWRKNRILFHDVINHTHGVNLFLENKIRLGQSITVEECRALQQEIVILQNILQDHFALQHRSLRRLKGIIHFYEAKEIIDRMLDNYFLHSGCQITQTCSVDPLCLMHLPSFYRIMNNLIKNVLEARSSFLQLSYQQQKGNLLIQMISGASWAINRSHPKGVGLESVAYLVNLQQGNFTHHCEQGQWIVKISLPISSHGLKEVA